MALDIEPKDVQDVVIVGAGPAGLSAALILGRCRRRVLVLDDGIPRNAPARHVHGFLTCDGMSPEGLRDIAVKQLAPYAVVFRAAHVTELARHDAHFAVHTSGKVWWGRKVLLATGVWDRWSDVPGALKLAGNGVYQCPYCHGWEVRERALGVYAPCNEAVDLALALKTWSSNVTLFTGGVPRLGPTDRLKLTRYNIQCYEHELAEIVAKSDGLDGVRLSTGKLVALEALFIHAGQQPRNALAEQLGCKLEPEGTIRTGPKQQTNVPGLFVAGDLAADVQSVAVAVAEGYKAGAAINRELREEDFT